MNSKQLKILVLKSGQDNWALKLPFESIKMKKKIISKQLNKPVSFLDHNLVDLNWSVRAAAQNIKRKLKNLDAGLV
jgi:hypothetical protein